MGINVVAASIIKHPAKYPSYTKMEYYRGCTGNSHNSIYILLLNYYFSQKKYFIPYEIRKLGILFLIGGIISFSGLLITDLHLLPRIIIKTFLLVGFPFFLYLLNFYETIELQAIKGFVTKWRNIKKFREISSR